MKRTNLCVSVVVFAYRRPQHLNKVLEALEKQKEAHKTRVTVYVDGPKTNDEKRQVLETTKIAKKERALENIKKINLILPINFMQTGVDRINLIFGKKIQVSHRRATLYQERLEEKSKIKAMGLLQKEYTFLAQVAELPPRP